MSTVSVGTIQSNTSDPVTFKNSSGTEIGTLCRAFCNFNGTGTVAIRASFNVSSITDNGTGNYTVNFTNAMPDANYSVALMTLADTSNTSTRNNLVINGTSATGATTKTTTQLNVLHGQTNTATIVDSADCNVAIFR